MDKKIDIPFFNRQEESARLLKLFRDETLTGHPFACVISGQKNSGKTAIIEKFIGNLTEDLAISSQLHDFNKFKHVVEFKCSLQSQTEPYSAFLSITSQILQNDKYKLLFSRLFSLLMTFIGASNAFNSLVQLAQIIKTNNELDITHLELKKFKRYKSFLKRLTRRVPVIFIIKDAQYLDIHSLKLIESILYNPSGFTGVFFLEMNENLGDSDATVSWIYNLIKAGKVEKIQLNPLDPDFPRLMLEPVLGTNFLTNEENELLFTVSKGLPGNLVELFGKFVRDGWIYEENGKWLKAPNFKEKFQPKEQQLIELLIVFFSDNVVNDAAMAVVKKMVRKWGLADDYIEFCFQMVSSIRTLGYRFEKTLPWGFLSEYVFQVVTPDDRHMIVEYLPTQNNSLPLKHDKVFNHENIAEATKITQFDDGILVEWGYIEGKRMREVLLERKSLHLDKCLKLVTEVIQGLRELHKYNIIHTYITPEAVIESNDGTYMLATLDLDILGFLRGYGRRLYSDSIYYSAPELLSEEKPSVRSDIYSLGMLLFRLITNTLPFINLDPKRAKEQIINGKLNFSELKGFDNSELLDEFFQGCLSKNPSDRFSNLDEFLNGLQKVRSGLSPAMKTTKSTIESMGTISEVYKVPILKYVIRTSILVVFLTICILVFNYYSEIKSIVLSSREIEQVVIEVIPGNKDFSTESPMIHEEIEFLIQENLLRTGNVSTIGKSEFRVIKESDDGVEYVPKLYIKGELSRSKAGYELLIIYESSGKIIKDTTVTFNEPVTFLQKVLPVLSASILAYKNVKMENKTPICTSWDAFTSFLKGRKAWHRMDKTTAKSEFEKALYYDPEFTLAKLKLLEVLKFEGGNTLGIDSLITGVKKNMSNLSDVDSVRLMAVEYTILGSYLKSVSYYKQIAEKLPYDKFSFYEIAEAYYQLVDNDNAIEYYRKSLSIDPDFTLALNHLGYSLLNKYKAEEALGYFRRYVELDSSANSFDSMADGFFAAGLIDSAIK
jgi:serine/threonine protein kinase